MVGVHFRAPALLRDSLGYVAAREGRSVADLLTELAGQYLDGWQDPTTGDPAPRWRLDSTADD